MLFIPVSTVSLVDTVIVSVTSLSVMTSVASLGSMVIVGFDTLVAIGGITVMVSAGTNSVPVITVILLMFAVGCCSGIVSVVSISWLDMMNWCRIVVSVSGFGGN